MEVQKIYIQFLSQLINKQKSKNTRHCYYLLLTNHMNIAELTKMKQIEQSGEQYLEQSNQQIKSQFTNAYKQLMEVIDVDQQQICQILSKKGITFNPNSSYQPFQFEVKKLIPNFNYYTIQTKIGHFRMNITAKKNPINLLQNLQSVSGSNEKIYFVNINQQPLCFKSYKYSNQTQFQNIFNIVVKQLTILKICSALECSLFMDNFLGYDIIIYDDCIQFAMQKGKKIDYITQSQAIQLKKQLKLMHHLKIIHFDIKPQNIIYSHYYNKTVFIDFGFSEIIQQICGFKTLTEFRGTPKFSSPQILAIMISEKAYIDLYYNDAYSLNEVLIINKNTSYIPSRIKENKFQKISKDLNDFFDQDSNSNQSSNFYIDNQLDFLLLSFEFYYLNAHELKSKELLLKWFINSTKMVKRVLSFIKNIISYVFLSNIFYCELKQYQNQQDYLQIESIQKSNGVRFFFKKTIVQNDEILNEPIEYQPSSFISGKNQRIQQYHQYVKMIVKMQCIQQQFLDNFISIVFQCIRFDTKNLQLKDKIIIAKKAIYLLNNYQDNQGQQMWIKVDKSSSIQQIKDILMTLYKCSINSKYRWCKDNIFNIFEQLVLLDIDYSSQLDNLFKYLQQNCQSLQDLIIVLLQARRLLNAYQMIQTQHFQKRPIIKSKFNAFIDQQQKNISSFNKKANDPSSIIMRNHYLDIFCSNQTNVKDVDLFQYFHEDIKNIKNDKFRKNMLQFVIYRKIDSVFCFQSTEKILELAKVIRQITTIQKLYFLPYIRITLKLLISISDFKNLRSFSDYITVIINCDQISKRLIAVIQRQADQQDHKIISNKIMRLIKMIPLFPTSNSQIQSQIFDIYYRIKEQEVFIDQNLKDNLIQLYQLYSKRNNIFLQNPALSGYYHAVFCKSKIEFFFYNLSPHCQHLFLHNLSTSQQKLNLNYDLQKPLQFVSSKFRFLCYKYQLSTYQKNYEESIEEINQLFLLCKHLRMVFLAFQIFKQVLQSCFIQENQQDLTYFIQKTYQLCKQIQYYSFYLVPCNSYCGFVTFATLARTNVSSLYQFINYLTSFLHVHPIDSYVQVFFFILDKFLRFDSFNSHLIHYQHFQRLSLNDNPYNLIFYVLSLKNQNFQNKLRLFKIIATHVNNLSQFARKQLLKKYFCIFIEFHRQDKRRKRIFMLRQAKRYISKSDCISQLKGLFKLQKIKHNEGVHKKYKQVIKSLIDHIKAFKQQGPTLLSKARFF